MKGRKRKRTCPGCEKARKEIVQLKAIVEKLMARIARLEEELRAEKEKNARLNMNSSNSSLPPSKDPPYAPPRVKKPPTGRNRGAQPGHGKTARDLIPSEEVDERTSLKPPSCSKCGRKLRGNDPDPRRHQVSELPEIKPHVTEYLLHELECDNCGTRTRAALPDDVPRGNFGPRLQAVVGVLTGVYNQSKRSTAAMLRDLFGVTMSLGSVPACEKAVSEAVAAPVEEARKYVEAQPVANVDETGWPENNRKGWLWVASTALVSVFLIRLSRGAEAAKELLKSFSGILVSDRWVVYSKWDKKRRQLCWAHLIRDFVKFTELSDQSAIIGMLLLEHVEQMFEWWYRIRDGTLRRSTFQRYMGPLKETVRQLLERGAECPDRKTVATCSDLLENWPALWTFVSVPGVEPTNNGGERDLRRAVLWRKSSFGTASSRGSRFVERILTVATTLKKQDRNVLDFVVQACHARYAKTVVPSLLPG
jgi:transposase